MQDVLKEYWVNVYHYNKGWNLSELYKFKTSPSWMDKLNIAKPLYRIHVKMKQHEHEDQNDSSRKV